MDNPVIVGPGLGPEPERGGTFKVTVLTTLAIGVGLASLGIFHFRAPEAPPPQVIEKPPVIQYVEKPGPPPEVNFKPPAVPVPLPNPTPAPAPPVTAPPVAAPPVWDGVWRRKEYPLPMFRLNQAGYSVHGTCAPNWQTVLRFGEGSVIGDTLEFMVDDQVFRLHVRMTMQGDDKAKVEQWVSDEDWALSLERAQRAAKTPQQALLARAILEQNARKFRKPVTVGVFTRQTGE